MPVENTTVVLRRAPAKDVPAIVELVADVQIGATRDGILTDEDLARADAHRFYERLGFVASHDGLKFDPSTDRPCRATGRGERLRVRIGKDDDVRRAGAEGGNAGVGGEHVRRSLVDGQVGRFRVFSATCTHAGCTVSSVVDRRINCPCHGSKFAISDGSAVAGPAESPLPTRSFKIRRGKLYLT